VIRFFVSGWSSRFSLWHSEVIEAKSKSAAKERFVALRPTLKRVKILILRS
jgi:hypothetical protein